MLHRTKVLDQVLPELFVPRVLCNFHHEVILHDALVHAADQRCNFHSILHAFQLVDNRIVLFDHVLPLLEAVQEVAHVEFRGQDVDQKARRSRTRLRLAGFHEFVRAPGTRNTRARGWLRASGKEHMSMGKTCPGWFWCSRDPSQKRLGWSYRTTGKTNRRISVRNIF